MRKIVFVSRLDADCSLGAHVLCHIAPDLAKNFDDLKIIILGGGTEFGKIKRKASKINRIINRKLIFALGSVDSPTDFFDENTIFLGVSRAALEAMAHRLPIILIGNEGYLGLLDESKLEIAQKTNFTCRENGNLKDFSTLSTQVYKEICNYFSLSKEEQQKLKNFSFNIVKNGYTSLQMATKTMEIYQIALENHKKSKEKLKKSSKKVAICGYYGKENLGDEAILQAICTLLDKSAQKSKICLINSKNPFKILKNLWRADLFVFGGGSLLQNSTSNASLLYYLFVMHLASMLCGQKIMLANGVGPIKNGLISRKTWLSLISRATNKLDFISVRDTFSQNLLSSLLPSRKIHLIPDPTLIFAQEINQRLITQNNGGHFVFIPCSSGLKNEGISLDLLASSLEKVAQSWKINLEIVVLNSREDISDACELAHRLKNARVTAPRGANELFEILSGAKFMISQRYHGALFSAMMQIPTLAVSNDPKMHALCKDFGLFPCRNTKILNSEDKILENLSSLQGHHVKNKEKIAKRCWQNSTFAKLQLKKILKF